LILTVLTLLFVHSSLAAQTELITNGSFVSGSTGWTRSGNFFADSRFSNCRTCSGYSYVTNSDGKAGNNLVGTMYQSVNVPSNSTTATISFWYHITTQETRSIAFDTLNVTIQNSSGGFLANVAVLSNVDSGSGYAQKSVSLDLTPYRGQTIRLHFLATTDVRRPSTFRVDNVSILSGPTTLTFNEPVSNANIFALSSTGSAQDQAKLQRANRNDTPIRGQSDIASVTAVVNFDDLARRDALQPSTPQQPRFVPEPEEEEEEQRDKPIPPDATIFPQESSSALSPIQPLGPSPVTSSSFLGVPATGWFPPDSQGVAGPNHLLVAVNGGLVVQTKSGTNVGSVRSLSTFFGPVTGGSTDVFDPRLQYDPLGNRWIVIAVADRQSAASALLVAVSQTSDPTGFWNLTRIDADPIDQSWADFPMLGFNKDWIVVSANMFPNPGSSAQFYPRFFVLNKVNFYSGGTSFTRISGPSNISGTIMPASTFDPNLSTLYLLQNWNGNFSGSGFLRLYSITGAVGAEVLNNTSSGVFITTPNPWDSSATGNFAPQLGTTNKIQINDASIQNLLYRNGSLWCVHAVFLPAGGSPTRSSVQWWQINPTSLSVQQRGRIDDASGNLFYGYPSIAVNTDNDVLIGYSRFAANQFASGGYAYRAVGDPVNSLRDDTVLKAGVAAYSQLDPSGRNRWGDYSGTSVDPSNGKDFWTLQEYAASTNNWGTWWGRISPPQCTYSFSSTENTVGPGNGSTNFLMHAPSGCAWTAVSDATSWLTTSSSGSGDGTISYDFAANTSSTTRIGHITAGGQVHTVTQLGVGGAGSVQFSSATYSVNETGTTATITVTRSSGVGSGTVQYSTSNGTATAGSDYQSASGLLLFAETVTSRTFDVPILDDGVFEGNESITLTLSNPDTALTLGNPSTATLTIVDNEVQPTTGTNFALASNGGIASASSTTPNTGFPGYNFAPATAIDGNRKSGVNFWRDDTANTYPDWLQVDFNGTKSITEIDVFTMQDNDQNPSDPTLGMTFVEDGITAFDVQYWNGSAWVTVPNGSVTGNNKVWRQFTFSAIATSKVRVLVNNALNTRSRIVELEAWDAPITSNTNHALAVNGGVASASSTTPNAGFPGYNFVPATAIDGDRKSGVNFWRDDTANTYPDWLQVDFNGTKNITEIDVFTMQDNDQNPSDPTLGMTFVEDGITAFDVQYWNGSAWVTVPNGSVTGNNKVWRQFTFSAIATSKVRVLVNNALNTRSRIVELEAWDTPITGNTNHALAVNGGVASASSTTPNAGFPGYNFVPATAIDGDRKSGVNFWRDDTANTYPDWLQVDFNGTKSITEIDVFTMQDNDQNPSDPTLGMTFVEDGITAFDVQYWDGSAWVTVPNGSVTGNNKVWRQFTFSAIATSKVRVLVNNALNTRSRIVELEAWSTSNSKPNQALAVNGAVASASSTTPNAGFPGYNFLPGTANDGDRKSGVNFWRDDTANTYPDWLQIDFNGTKNISEIDVFTMQDNDQNPSDPTLGMTFVEDGITAFDVQYWTGSAWVTVPNGSVTGNNKVWRQFTFSPIATDKIRVLVSNALNGRSRIVELEAY
jgi:hypothetical protein